MSYTCSVTEPTYKSVILSDTVISEELLEHPLLDRSYITFLCWRYFVKRRAAGVSGEHQAVVAVRLGPVYDANT